MTTLTKKHRRSCGVTVIEVVIAIAILGTVVFLTRVGVDFFNNVKKQQNLLESQRDAQLVLFNIMRDIRNSTAILQADATTLQLNMLDVKQWGFNAPELFDPVNIGTVTYQFKRGVGNHLERKAEYARGPGTGDDVVAIQNFLTNIIADPQNSVPPYDLFVPDGAMQKVDVTLKINPPLWAQGAKSREYKTEAMKRRIN